MVEKALVLCYIFVFFGGWMLFDFSRRYFVATAACAFVIAVVASVFAAQEQRIEQLESTMIIAFNFTRP